MKIAKIISKTTLLTIILTIISVIVMSFQDNFHAHLFKLATFFFYSSILLSGNYVLVTFAKSTSPKIIQLITISDFFLIVFSGLVLFDIIPFSTSWHLILGISILYILSIQLNLLGWSGNKHSIIHKMIFLIVLLSDLFLASIFIFKINNYGFRPLIITCVILSTLFLLVGIYFNSRKIKSLH